MSVVELARRPAASDATAPDVGAVTSPPRPIKAETAKAAPIRFFIILIRLHEVPAWNTCKRMLAGWPNQGTYSAHNRRLSMVRCITLGN
jgi:hypothetical protein